MIFLLWWTAIESESFDYVVWVDDHRGDGASRLFELFASFPDVATNRLVAVKTTFRRPRFLCVARYIYGVVVDGFGGCEAPLCDHRQDLVVFPHATYCCTAYYISVASASRRTVDDGFYRR